MGLRDVYGSEDAVRRAAYVAATDRDEKTRKNQARIRTDLYCDDVARIVWDMLDRQFDAAEVKEQLGRYLDLCGANSLLKRVVDEIARPVYASAPQRRVLVNGKEDPKLTAEYRTIARKVGLDGAMDMSTRILLGGNRAFLGFRWLEREDRAGGKKPGELVADLLTPSMVSVVPDLDVPTRAAGLGYDRCLKTQYGMAQQWSFWDDEIYFGFDSHGLPAGKAVEHGIGRIPVVQMRRRMPWSTYWDRTTGNDLVAGTLQSCLINAMLLYLHRMQGHIQVTFVGDSGKVPRESVIDLGSLLSAEEGQFGAINLQADPTHLLNTKAAIETTVAANWGLSRDRLNQKTTAPSEDAALNERTSELMAVMREAEIDAFDIIRRIWNIKVGRVFPDEANLALNFGPLKYRVERMAQLKIREEEIAQGLRSELDGIIEDNPEIPPERAMDFLTQKVEERRPVLELFKTLNAQKNADGLTPGATAQEYGATGPLVRDQKITRDQAARATGVGQGQTASLRAIAARALGYGNAA